MTFNRGPFAYTGNKYKLFTKTLHNLIPYDTHHIVEPFVGSGVVLYNSQLGGVGSDIDENVIELHKVLTVPDFEQLLTDKMKQFFPSGGFSKSEFYDARDHFNKNQNDMILLHLLVQNSFNSLLRFGPNGFNTPYGFKRKLSITKLLKSRDWLLNHPTTFKCQSFDNIQPQDSDFVYCDPPYLVTNVHYDHGWDIRNEAILLLWLDALNENGIKFGLSNAVMHKGHDNVLLQNWMQKYHVIFPDMKYNAWSSNAKGAVSAKDTVEVYVTNFICTKTSKVE